MASKHFLTHMTTEDLSDEEVLQSRRRWNLLWILFSFKGRIDRTQFWVGYVVIVLLAFFALLGISSALDNYMSADEAEGVAVILMLPFTIWLQLALAAKRFHDRNKSGWWSLVTFIPFIGEFWILGECGGMAGTPGPNRYYHEPAADEISVSGDSLLPEFARFIPEIVILIFYLFASLVLDAFVLFGLGGC